jgi:hypothetical protein
MLGFLFGSAMFLVMLGSLALMLALKRHKKFKRFTKWLTFACALMAGSAAALCFVGEWGGGALAWAADYLLGAPAAVGILALFITLAAVVDLLDGEPDGFARTAALTVPSLLAVTGGALGLYGSQATGAVSQAGAALLGSLIGL